MPSERGVGEASRAESERFAASFNAALSGRYVLERELGRGGNATVYLARDERHPRHVAIKFIHPDVARSLGTGRFLREIQIAADLQHPHILGLHDSGEIDGAPYYVMPYVDGESLRSRLDRARQLPVDEALQIAREVAGALDYAHRRGVVHRDVKPENILIEDGHAVLADFGIARAMGGTSLGPRTATGTSVGTPAYMSPEQAAGDRHIDGRSDIYALGCVLYEMLAGEPPFTGPTAESVIRQHLIAEPRRITSVRASVPIHVADVIRRALEKTPADRFTRAGDFADALGDGGKSSRQEPRGLDPHQSTVMPTLAGTLVLAAAGIVWALTRPASSGPAEPTHPAYTIVANVAGSAPPEIRNSVQNLIAIRLNQSSVLRTVAASDLQRGLALAGLPDTTDLNVGTARDLAFRESIRTVVASTVDQMGGAFVVTVQLLNAEDGAVVAAEASKAQTGDQVVEAVEKTIDAVRRRVGERPAVVAATRDLKGVATPSLEAFKHFVLASEHHQNYTNDGACLREARNALRLDSAFAKAWSVLGFCHNNNMGNQDSAIVAWQRALELRHRLSEFDVHNLTAVLALVRDGNPALALAEFEIAGSISPLHAGNNRAVVIAENFGGHEQAAEIYRDLRARSPFGPTKILLTNSVRNLIALGRFAEAESLYQMVPPASQSPRMQLSLAAAQHDWEKLESIAAFHDSNPGTNLTARSASAEGLAGGFAARGRLQDATRQLRSAPRLASVRLANLNRSEWLLGAMRAEFGGSRPARTPELETPIWKAMRAAYEGDSSRAFEHLRASSPNSGPATGRRGGGRIWQLALALIDARRGRHTAVVESLAGQRHIYYQVERWWLLANAFERLGEADSSAAYLARLTARKGIYDEDNLLQLGIVYPFARFRLGRHYAARGDGARAGEHLTAFLDTFTNPDPEFTWMVTEAQGELGKMALDR